MDLNLGYLFLSEMLGTLVLVAMGTSINAAVNAKKSYAYAPNKNGWILVTIGWGLAIMAGAAVANYSGGSINPAVSLGNLIVGSYSWGEFGVAVAGELAGAILGALLTVLLFWNHFQVHYASQSEDVTVKYIKSNEDYTNEQPKTSNQKDINLYQEKDDSEEYYQEDYQDYYQEEEHFETYDTLRGIFATAPSIDINQNKSNIMLWITSFVAEAFGTFLLVAGLLIPSALFLTTGGYAMVFTPIYAGLLVMGIGLTIGGLTGFAINPARDLGPRLVYQFMPNTFKDRKSAQWSYSWVPIAAPFAGAAVAAGFAEMFANI